MRLWGLFRKTGSNRRPGLLVRPSIVPRMWSFCWPAWPHRDASWRRPAMPTRSSFDYAIVRVVPRVEREEFVNAGVILFCLEQKFLEARIQLDESRLKALWP